jgi:hypothetical protein
MNALMSMRDRLRSRVHFLWLVALVTLAVGLRLGYLYWEMNAPGFQWSDPDGYLRQAAALTWTGHWRWTLKAIQYDWGGQTWLLPPGYPVFLSFFVRADSPDPLAAAVAQAVLGGLASAAMYVYGRSLHTPRSGLIAAFVWAIWFPAVAGRETFVQEQLYVPLLWAALAALACCISTSAPSRWLFVTGLLLGICALIRAMPLFFLAILLPLLVFFWRREKDGGRRTAAFLGGFALVTATYIAWLSVTVGHLVLIDDHMMIIQTDMADRRSVPSAIAIALGGFVQAVGYKAELVEGLFKVYGPSWLYHYGGAVRAEHAPLMGLVVHLSFDTLFVTIALLAPIGLAVARQRQVSALAVGWILFGIVASAAAGFTGLRYRAPLEGLLICGAAALIAGDVRRPSWTKGGIAIAVSLLLGAITLPAYIDSWSAPVPYGLRGWTEETGIPQTSARGAVGFYAPSLRGAIDVEIEAMADTLPADLLVKVEGVPMEQFQLAPGGHKSVRIAVGNRLIAFVEIVPQSGEPAYYIRTRR